MATSLNQKIVQRLDNHMSRAVGKGNARAAVINSTRGMIGSFTPVSADLPWERHDTARLMAFAERVAANGGTTVQLLAAIKQEYGQTVYDICVTAINSPGFARKLDRLEQAGL